MGNKITIDEERLHSFLQERKTKILTNKISFDGLFSVIVFFFTLVTVDYNKIDFLSNKIIIFIGWISFILYLTYQLYKLIKAVRTKYTLENLYNDIKSLQREASNFSLIMIKINNKDFYSKIL